LEWKLGMDFSNVYIRRQAVMKGPGVFYIVSCDYVML
jgi:hypothetical protein